MAPSLGQFEDNRFYFVYSRLVLQHMEPQYSRRYIGELIRILTPEGLLIFQIHSERDPASQPPPPRKGARRLMSLARKRLRSVGWLPLRGFIPEMEMHGVPRPAVVNTVKQSGGRVVDVDDDRSGGREWISFRYLVTK